WHVDSSPTVMAGDDLSSTPLPRPRLRLARRSKVEKLCPVFQEIKSVHFVGICGTAMASVAAAMQQKGFHVTGSDQNVYPPMSTFLAERRIEVVSGFADRNLAGKPDLVVIGNAISRGNPEVETVLEK